MIQAPLALSIAAEKTQLAAAIEHSLSAVVSLKAPESAPSTRQPLEIVAVVDRSGSMGSDNKMRSMKEALSFLVEKGLQNADKFSLVSFDNVVELRLGLTAMDATGKKKALETVRELNTGGTTNLSGGLLRGIDVLASTGQPNANRAVLLFTDGIANNGITDTAGIVAAVQGAMAGSPMTIFTFGFGADHTESLLRTVAEQTNGLYYYVQKSEDIPVSFADCLGGLVSVVAQNVVLTIQGLEGGSSVARAHCHYKQDAPPQPGAVALVLGDLYAEDETDILVTLNLPPLAAPRDAETPALRAMLRFFSVAGNKMEEVTCELTLGRPTQTTAGQVAPAKVEETKERIALSEAMVEASALADRGQLAQGRSVLQAAVAHARASPCVGSAMVSNVIRDAVTAEERYSDEVSYRSMGSKLSQMSAMSNMQQRSTHSSGQAYERKSKMAMKSMFASSMSASMSLSAPAATDRGLPGPAGPSAPGPAPCASQAPASAPPPTASAPPTMAKGRKSKFKLPTLHSFRSSSAMDID